MRCARCGRDNPQEMQFCIYCGTRLVATTPTEATGVATQQVTLQQALRPAYRPFGVVFIVVYSVLSGLAWIAVSLYPIMGAMVAAPFEVESKNIVGLAMLSIVLEVLGILQVTGALGLWLLTRWGRNWTAGLQVVSIILGVVMLVASASEKVQRANLTGLLVLMGLLTILAGIAIMVYLLRAEMDIWFQEK